MIHCKYDELVKLSEIKIDPANRNKHSKEQIEQLAKIIEYQGWRHPLIINQDTKVLRAGHGRLQAAKKLKIKEVPVVYQQFKDFDQDYAFMVSDNAIGHQSELDISGINLDIGMLGPDFDIDLLGIKNFTIDVAEQELDETTQKLQDDMNKKYIIEVTFPNDMEMMDIHDDLVSRGYIVKIKDFKNV